MTTTELTRNASLSDLAELLKAQHEVKLDAVVPASRISSVDGNLHIKGLGMEAQAGLNPDAVEVFRPTDLMDGHLAEKLGIPVLYLRKLRVSRPDLFDANVNGWLHGSSDSGPDPRTFLVRTFRGTTIGDTPEPGIARALLSDRYRIVDNYDVLVAALDGVKASGAEVDISGCDLSERRMQVRINAPGITAIAPTLLGNYRSPYSGKSGADLPVVSAGLVLTNAETGGAAFTITPRITFLVCTNGMTMTKDAFRNVHLGGKLEDGVVRWSDETQQKNLELITSTTADAVRSFLDVDYVKMVLADMERQAMTELSDPNRAVEVVAKQLRFTEETTKGILDHFMVSSVNPSAPRTAGDIMQAITSHAQRVDADLAFELEGLALQALSIAAGAA